MSVCCYGRGAGCDGRCRIGAHGDANERWSVGRPGVFCVSVCSNCVVLLFSDGRGEACGNGVVQHNMYRGLASVTPLKLYYYASIIGLIPVILLGMQSIGGVTAWDILLLTLFLGLGCFYIHKRF